MRILIILLSSSLFFACQEQNPNSGEEITPLHGPVRSVLIAQDDKYLVNQFTQDSLFPLVNRHGNPVLSGIPFQVNVAQISLDTMPKPQVEKLIFSDEKIIRQDLSRRLNVSIKAKFFSPRSQRSTLVGKGDQGYILLNSTGDTVKTGSPNPLKGTPYKCYFPAAVKASDPVSTNTACGFQYIDVLDVEEQPLAYFAVSGLLEDNQGNIWIAKEFDGISKYDTRELMHYDTDQGLPNNIIICMIKDHDGNIWLGTPRNGIIKYDGKEFTNYTEKSGLSARGVTSLLEDRNGQIWVGTYNNGVSKIDGDSITHYGISEGFTDKKINTIKEDSEGNIWFGTGWIPPQGGSEGAVKEGDGVIRYNGETFDYYTFSDGLSNNAVYSILEAKNGNLWFGTDNGLNLFNGNEITQYYAEEGLSDGIIALEEDMHGNIWISCSGEGVSKFNGEYFERYTAKDGMSPHVTEILKDSRGLLWFGTSKGELIKYDANSFILHSENSKHPFLSIQSMMEEKDGSLWMSNSGGITEYDGESYKHCYLGESIRDMLKDKKGNIWFATLRRGLWKYDHPYIYKFSKDQGLMSQLVYCLHEDRNGIIWMGSDKGLSSFDGTHIRNYALDKDLYNSSITSMAEDKKGTIWLGSFQGGVVSFNGKSFLNFTTREGLSSNDIAQLLVDEEDHIWIATRNAGVNKYDGKSFTYFSENEGLSYNDTRAIVQDRDHSIWVATSLGVTHISKISETLRSKEAIAQGNKYLLMAIDHRDGMKRTSFGRGAFVDNLGYVNFNLQRPIKFDQQKLNSDASPPNVSLNRIEISGHDINYHHLKFEDTLNFKYQSVDPFFNVPKNLCLPYFNNHLTFYFSAQDWKAPHEIKMSYRIPELYDAWSKANSEGKADYRNIPHGSFTLQIKAIGRSGIWSESLEYKFTVSPPWWKTLWAKFIYAILLVFSVMIYVRWRTMLLRKRQKQLEKEIDIATESLKIRNKEISTQKDEIEKEKDRSENLLLNILPAEIAEELKIKGKAEARDFDKVTIVFTDFKEFTQTSEKMSAQELVNEIHTCFEAFDGFIEKHGVEKIKTIGDAYMAAGGLPIPIDDSPKNTILAALEMQTFITKRKTEKDANGEFAFEMRVGIHSGPVVAGIVGVKKFQYDIWGDTVNTASRMESHGKVGKANISQTTYELLKDDPDLTFESRGIVEVKGKGEMEMYFVKLKNSP